ncbi:hypothetical protein H5410_041424 [Solanum commersonii]|uniref:Uncharacterized protein n=1 Tax=Solanum commersonii TaxID=4109 RepID=A0A9J5XVG1_SOLCO|nr:hypothetical protein H5410_041424 [Solanum commersonii]
MGKYGLFTNHGFEAKILETLSRGIICATIVYAKCDRSLRLDLWDDKKTSGLHVDMIEVDELKHCIESCFVYQLGFKGSPFTSRIPPKDWFRSCTFVTSVRINYGQKDEPFRFLMFWIEHETFEDVVRLNWDEEFSLIPFQDFKRKTKKVKRALSLWSKETFGDKFPFKENVKQIAKAEYSKNLCFEESYWQQKVGYNLFENRDRNTRFFHSLVKGRRHKLQNWFKQERDPTETSLLEHVPGLVKDEENVALEAMLDSTEIKKDFFYIKWG